MKQFLIIFDIHTDGDFNYNSSNELMRFVENEEDVKEVVTCKLMDIKRTCRGKESVVNHIVKVANEELNRILGGGYPEVCRDLGNQSIDITWQRVQLHKGLVLECDVE